MTDIVNLNSIRSDNCDCNKPKKTSCGCHDHNPQPCYQTIDLSNQYFKVKNLFGELKSEWQRTEARSNLGVTDIIELKQIKFGEGSGDTNIWEMVTSKGGSQKVYDFVVKNGEKGESATINVGDVFSLNSGERPIVNNVGTASNAILNFGIPKGEPGAAGKSAYDIYKNHGGLLSEEDWLESLKGKDGKDGEPGPQGPPGSGGNEGTLSNFEIVDFGTYTKTFLGDQQISTKMFIWRAHLNDGRYQDFWVPLSTGGGTPTQVGTPTFLYKRCHFDTKPTSAQLNSKLQELQQEVNVSNSIGKSVETLRSMDWWTAAPVLHDQGYDFIYMATSVITEESIGPWSVVQLTGTAGNDGSSGEGTRGQFTSIVFTRTNTDISNENVTGGSYDIPIPTTQTVYNGQGNEVVIWHDEIPNSSTNVQIWASSCIFYGDGTKSGWSKPRKMTDTLTYDVEFSPVEINPGNPTADPSNWYDPSDTLPRGMNWSDMIWRAERECHNGIWGNWIILRMKGEKGDPGTPGSGGQGLVGATIRLRGEWTNSECYVNQSTQTSSSATLRFIDIVLHNGEYYMVSPSTAGNCAQGEPGTISGATDWVLAENTDFAYINTLIADYLNVYTVDSEEIRIHSRESKNGSKTDQIVAGMTSGSAVDGEINDTNEDSDPIRIWAGTQVDVLTAPGENYELLLDDAPFRVRQSGKLEATDADIEGTIQANTLRLGRLNEDNVGTFERASSNSTITLPTLPGNMTQMFYLLTNNNFAPKVKPASGNNLQTPEKVMVDSSDDYQTTINKLYQCFGVESTWYIIEQDIQAASSIINPTNENELYGIRQITIIPTDQWTHPNDQQDQWMLQSQDRQGTVIVEAFNDSGTQQSITVPDIDVTIRYTAAQIQQSSLLTAPHVQDLYAVEYTIRISLGQLTVGINPAMMVENYTQNSPSHHVQITSAGYNGTATNPLSEKPDIGNAIVKPTTIKLAFGTLSDKTTINLTNIPISI